MSGEAKRCPQDCGCREHDKVQRVLDAARAWRGGKGGAGIVFYGKEAPTAFDLELVRALDALDAPAERFWVEGLNVMHFGTHASGAYRWTYCTADSEERAKVIASALNAAERAK